MAKPTARDAFVNNILRGLAILAVLAIHTLSSIHGDYYPSSGWSWIAVGLDQLSRFSVPLFVALSGYSFWQKYQGVPFHFWDFVKRQAGKLLPLYIGASLLFNLIFFFIPSWKALGDVGPLWLQLVRGSADYQLYFVPMIFELYLLFPLVKKLVEKLPWISLAVAFVFEWWLYAHATVLGNDQEQYRWFFTWIFYYVLGMHLPRIHRHLTQSSATRSSLYIATAVSFLFVATGAIQAVGSGVDPIIAMRFTEIGTLVYAGFAIVALFTLAHCIGEGSFKSWRPLVQLGIWSYPIYLFHTLLLRLVFRIPW